MDFQAFLIMLRETLEAVIIVGLIITYLNRLNASQYNKWVYAGVALAILSSLVVAMLFQVVFTGFSSFGSEVYVKVIIMFLSTLLLTHMVIWMKKESKDASAQTQDKLNRIVTTGSFVTMAVHAYLVVLREGVETVFFLVAITGGEIEEALTSYGSLSGVILAILIGYLFFSGTMRFSLKAFFSITGILIMLIAAGLFVKGVGILQDLGHMGSVYESADGKPAPVIDLVKFMPEHPIDQHHFERDTGESVLISGQIGIFFTAMFGYTHNPSVEQLAAYILYFVFVLAWMKVVGSLHGKFKFWSWIRSRSGTPAPYKKV